MKSLLASAKPRGAVMRGRNHHSYDRDGRVYAYGRIDGKTYRISTGLETNKANLAYVAREWETIVRERISPKRKGDVTVREFGLRSIMAAAHLRCATVQAAHLNDFEKRICPFFGARRLDSITPLEIREWQNNLAASGIGNGRVNCIRKVFTSIIKDALIEGLIEKNPFAFVKRLKYTPRPMKPFALNEVRLILREAGSGWYRNFLEVAFFTGMRPNEELSLCWNDINFQAQKIVIKKSKTEAGVREIDMLPLVEQALRRQFLETGAKGGLIFVSARGRSPDMKTLRTNWAAVLRRALLDYREQYVTRHTFASIMLSEGEELLWVSKTLGHKSPDITLKVYAKYIKKDLATRAKFLNGFCTQVAQSLHTTKLRLNAK